ncbi:hypothetical protein DB30_07486 [Enhygromyxa salina]|uniref:Uncharacterized protein n=2 Tax=Enhygromyxa salina TaxID=215803 RepID=A0A0C2CRM2_9BACT|nr:hypothetical protein DB30_07486 [Enhygromyxa salina]
MVNFFTDIEFEAIAGLANLPPGCVAVTACRAEQAQCNVQSPFLARRSNGGNVVVGNFADPATPIKLAFGPGPSPCGMPVEFALGDALKLGVVFNSNRRESAVLPLPCFSGPSLVLYVGKDGSTFYDEELLEPAALQQ